MKCLVCWRFIQMFKAGSELNHYSLLLRNDFFFFFANKVLSFLAFSTETSEKYTEGKLFFSPENIIPMFLCSLYRIGTGEECWLTEKALHPHICQGNNQTESVWHVFASSIISSLMFSSESKFIFMIKANSPLNLVITIMTFKG